MKINLKIIVSIIFLIFSQQTLAQDFVEGTYYSVIKGAKSSLNSEEVVEYFSYSCPGCYAMEPHIKLLKKQLPATQFSLVHLPFGGKNAKLSQQAFVLLNLLKGEKFHDRIFNRIHVDKNVFNDEDELIGFIENLGYERSLVESYLHSFAADTLTRSMNLETMKYQVRLAPTIIVGGKYKVDSNAVYSGTNLLDLVSYLSALSKK